MDELAARMEAALREIRVLLQRPLETEYARGGLTGAQRSVMQAVIRQDGLTLKALSEALGLAHSTVSGIVDRLAAKGLVERRTPPGDRRMTTLHATAAVSDFMAREAPSLLLMPLRRAFQHASAEERHAVARGVETLLRLLR